MRRIALLLALLLTACVPSGPTVTPTEQPKTIPLGVASVAPPTETPVPTETLEPTPVLPQYVTAVLMGFDRNQEGIGLRTDTFVIVSVRILPGSDAPGIQEVVVLSIPRDTLVDVYTEHGWVSDRINVAFLRGGFDGVRRTVQQNFGLSVNGGVYAVDFDGFIKIADTLGGLTVTPKADYWDWCGNYRGLLGIGEKGGYESHWKIGVPRVMTGAEVLCYIRARTQSDDLDRTRRGQDVLRAMKEQWFPTIITSPTIWPDLFRIIKSDLALQEALSFLPLADSINGSDVPVRMESMNVGQEVKYGKTQTGASVLVPLVDLQQWAMCKVVSESEAESGDCP